MSEKMGYGNSGDDSKMMDHGFGTWGNGRGNRIAEPLVILLIGARVRA